MRHCPADQVISKCVVQARRGGGRILRCIEIDKDFVMPKQLRSVDYRPCNCNTNFTTYSGGNEGSIVIILKQYCLDILNKIWSKLNNIRSKLNNFRSKLNNIRSKLNNIRSKLNNIRSKLHNIRSKLNNIRSKLNNIRSKLNNIRSKLNNIDRNFHHC